MNNKQESTILLICTSPLQILIAEKIIEADPNKNFDLLVAGSKDNSKCIYYYNSLKKLCSYSLYYASEPGLKSFLKFIIQFKMSPLNKKYQEIYLASIDSRYFQYIISKNIQSDIFTFDDGVVNITPNSLYYLNNKPILLKRFVWILFGIRYYIKDIKEMSVCHYTIYKNIPNIINNTQLIELYRKEILHPIKINKIIKIYLGQPLQNISDKFNDDYIIKVLDTLKIDYYYPHPRERETPVGDFKVIESFLVFEDYIVEYLKDNLDTEVEIYSFFSSAALNVANLERVEIKYLYNSYLYANYKYFYDLAKIEFKIDCLNLDF